MSKYIYIVIIIVAVGIVGGLLYVFVFNKGGTQVSSGGDTGNVSRIHPADATNFPKTEKIVLGTSRGSVQVNNFYKLVSDQEEDTLLIKKANEYLISYDTTDSSFWIFVTAGPVNSVQGKAAKDFLAILGISSKEACSLNASWGVSLGVDQNLAGKSYPLSFCAQSVQ